jgi:glycosyltransferase involved in cell wall biosynthesis
MTSTTPALSVITPVYNAEQYIERSYAFLRAQTFTNWEWIVVDDGSSDCTRRLVENLSDRRIRLITYPHNRGRGYARTKALAEACGQWMVVWDIDDLYFADRLARVEYARRAGYEFICSYAVLVDEELNITGARGFIGPRLGFPTRFTHPTLACDLTLARSIGYPSAMTTGEDTLMIIALSAKHRGCFYEDALIAYQQSRSDGPRKAIHNNWDCFQCLRLARARHLVEIEPWEMLLHATRTAAKLAMLVAMMAVPFTYRFAIDQRSSGNISPDWRLSPDRLEFITAAFAAWHAPKGPLPCGPHLVGR